MSAHQLWEELKQRCQELEAAMTADERKAAKREHYISFIYGNGNWSNPNRMTREQVTAWVDAQIASGEIVL
jgi:hypothetical protein